MGTLALIVAVAVVAAAGGYLAGRRRRPARRVFVAGFLCGSVTGVALRHRRVRQTFRRVLSGSRQRGRGRAQQVRLGVR